MPTGQVVELWRFANGGIGFVGVETCGSVWSCPVCAAKVAEKRREEVGKVVDGQLAAGGGVYMLTVTVPHNAFDKCGRLRDNVAKAWRKVQGGSTWSRLKERFRIAGTVRSLEVTHGGNGWHPHLHVLIGTHSPLSDAEQKTLHRLLFDRWAAMVLKVTNGARRCEFSASDFRLASAADYVAKWGCVEEITRAVSKLGRNGGRSPWQLLRDYRDHGDVEAGELFRQYAKAFKGARHLTWSKEWKRFAGELDEKIAADAGETDHPELPLQAPKVEPGKLGSLDRATAKAIYWRQLTGAVVDAARKDGWHGVELLLARYGLGSYYTPDDFPKFRPPPSGPAPNLARVFPHHLMEPTEDNLARYFRQYGPRAR